MPLPGELTAPDFDHTRLFLSEGSPASAGSPRSCYALFLLRDFEGLLFEEDATADDACETVTRFRGGTSLRSWTLTNSTGGMTSSILFRSSKKAFRMEEE